MHILDDFPFEHMCTDDASWRVIAPAYRLHAAIIGNISTICFCGADHAINLRLQGGLQVCHAFRNALERGALSPSGA